MRIIEHNYFQDPLTDIYVSSESPEFPAENLKKPFRSKVWRSDGILPIESIVIDLKVATEIDSFLIIFDPNRPGSLSPQAELTLQASETNSWDFPAFVIALSTDYKHDVISHYFNAPVSYRYWRLVIADEDNGNGYVEIPKLVLGKSITFSRAPRAGFALSFQDLSVISSTPYGHEYVDLYPQRRSLNLDFTGMNADDLQLIQDIYRNVGKTHPITVAIDPNGVTVHKDFFTLYGTVKEFKPSHLIKNYFNFSLTIQETL